MCGGGGLARRKRRGSRQSALINEKSIFNENKTRQDVSYLLIAIPTAIKIKCSATIVLLLW